MKKSWLAFGMATASLLLTGLSVYLERESADWIADLVVGFWLMTLAVVGVLVVHRKGGNPIAWVLLTIPLLITGSLFAAAYGEYVFELGHRELPFGATAAWFSQWLSLPGFGLFMIMFLRFPDGALLSGRWAWIERAAILGIALGTIAFIVRPGGIETIPSVENPTGIDAAEDMSSFAENTGSLLLALVGLATIVSLVIRYRRSIGDTKQQLKWFVFAVALFPLIFVAGNFVGAVEKTEEDVISFAVIMGGAMLIPLGIGIAILKYRLYDIDVVINKTLVFGSLAAFITAVYVAIVVGLGTALGSSDEPNLALSIAATAIVAIAFQPVKDRVQRVANRLVYGHRQTPYEVLSDFSAKVASSYETEEVTPAMAQTLKEATNAARADVWLAIDGSLVRAASSPAESFEASSVSLNGAGLPVIEGADHAVAVTHQQELLGALSVTKDPGDPLSAADHKLLDDLSSQAGIVLRNSRLTAELRARLEQISVQAKEIRSSRQRIVSTQDKERRRLERDIHDGAQQHLVALAVKLRLAKTMTERKPERAHAMLEQLKTEMKDALDTLSDLAKGIYPPLLKDKGIGPALAARADTAPFEVAIQDTTGSRFDPSIEAAVYFCCLEALQNTAKYAHATHATITLTETDDTLGFMVADDGRGFDPSSTSTGTGTQGMADRLAAVGGTLTLTSAPGQGTIVTGNVPVRPRALT